MNNNESSSSNPVDILRSARDAWHSARPVDSMRLLASMGMDYMARRETLRSWGCNDDDVIDFSSDMYIEDETVPCSFTGCRGHYLALGLSSPVWCEDHSDLAPLADVWELCENPPVGCQAVANLYHWSTNYDGGKGPFSLFVDLIGWSEDNLGEPIYSLQDASLGYVEISKLADALKEYSDAPHDVRSFVDALIEAEGR